MLVELTAVLSPGGVTGLDADLPSTTKLITAVRSLLSDNPGLQVSPIYGPGGFRHAGFSVAS